MTSGPEQNHQGYDVGQWKRKSKKKKKMDRTGDSLELDGTSRGGSALRVGLKPSRSISFGSWTDWVSGAGSGMDWVKGAGCRTDSMVAVATGQGLWRAWCWPGVHGRCDEWLGGPHGDCDPHPPRQRFNDLSAALYLNKKAIEK